MTNAYSFVNLSNLNGDGVVSVNLYDWVWTFASEVEFAVSILDGFPNVLVKFELMFCARSIGT